MRRRLLAASVGALLLGAAPAHAATFQVNTTTDSGVCNAITCSVRGAFAAAQANGSTEDDVITVPAGIYAVPQLITTTGSTRVTITGAGANATFIQPTGTTTRVFQLDSSSGLTLRGLTVRNGRPATEDGGNILARSQSTLTLDRVRVTNGQAPNGGGIGSLGSGTLTITNSLIDANNASGNGIGGGIYIEGQTFPTPLVVLDSTVAFNRGAGGAGIATSASSAAVFRGATVAYNAARNSQFGVGGIQSTNGGGGAVFQGSLIAANTTAAIVGNGTIVGPANCSFAAAVTDQGGNVEDQDQCELTASSLRTTSPQLATTLDAEGTLALPATSPAVDFADCVGRTLDQRGTPRPQGARCDAGAYEYNPPPTTAIAGAAPPFTFSSNEVGTTYECSLDGAPFTPCASPYDPGAGPGVHTLVVRAVDAQGVPDPNPQTVAFTVQPPPQPTPTPVTPVPTPVVDRTVVVAEVKGTVKVKLPGTRRYVDLDAARGIPVGSTVDTRKGTVELTSIPKAGAPPEKARFFDGIFRISQARGITTLKLTEPLAACPKRKGARASAKKASKRKLWGDGKGAFRTQGKYSAATVRGTKWLVQDSCAGTLTRVTQGSVTVTHGKKRIVVRAGKRYLAKPR